MFVGSVTGLILLSILADRLGRKTIIVSTLFMTAIGAMCTYFYIGSFDYWSGDPYSCFALCRAGTYGIWRVFAFDGLILFPV